MTTSNRGKLSKRAMRALERKEIREADLLNLPVEEWGKFPQTLLSCITRNPATPFPKALLMHIS